MKPVFLHTGWRTAGTWLWSRFRALPDVTAFYEPLNEVLASLSRRRIDAMTTTSWESGHPALARPYFAEFAPLLRAGVPGVPGYRPGFAIDRFSPDAFPASERAALAAYLTQLIRLAEDDGKAAVLKFCRSTGRLDWMLEAFPQAVHCAVIRHPVAQWASAWQQYMRYGNTYFLGAPLMVVSRNLHDPRVARAVDAFGLRGTLLRACRGVPVAQHLDACRRRVPGCAAEVLHRVFVAHWTLSALPLGRGAAVLIDGDRLGASPSYRDDIAATLAGASGLRPDLSDARGAPADAAGASCEAWLGLSAAAVAHAHRAAADFAVAECPGAPALPMLCAKLACDGRLPLRR